MQGTSDADKDPVLPLYMPFKRTREFSEMGVPFLHIKVRQMEYFCLPIAEMDYYDLIPEQSSPTRSLSPTPPIFQHFDLIAGEIGNGFIGDRF